MSVLIITFPGDIHALAMRWALAKRGVASNIMCWSDYPQRMRVSFELNEAFAPAITIDVDGADQLAGAVSTIWNRRKSKFVPPSDVRLADHAPILESSDRLFAGVTTQLDEQAFAVNKFAVKNSIDNKVNQLTLARASGFHLPATLVTNDYQRVTRFVDRHGDVIVKPLKFMSWQSGKEFTTLYTTELMNISQIEELSITACPLIYQQKIDKICEYRTVVMGLEIINYRIDSQKHALSSTDFRILDYKNLDIKPERLPEYVEEAIRIFMRNSGAVFGSFDFALNGDGDVIFFEFNEQGQFLWLEERAPELPLLDMVASFLAGGIETFIYRPSSAPAWFSEYDSSLACDELRADREQRVAVNLDKRFPDIVTL